MFWHAFQTIVKTISTKKLNHQWNINIFIHFLTTESQGLMRFPHQYPPPRPRPSLFCASTAAFASRSRSTTESWPNSAAKCSGVLPQQPQPEASHGQNPTKRRGENFGRLKSRSFGNFGHSKILPELQGTLWFWGCFDDIKLAEKAMSMRTKLAVKMHCGNWKRCSISKITNMRAIGTQPNLKLVLCGRYFL